MRNHPSGGPRSSGAGIAMTRKIAAVYRDGDLPHEVTGMMQKVQIIDKNASPVPGSKPMKPMKGMTH